MRARPIEVVPKRADAHAVLPGLLTHLSEIDDDYMIADPLPDVRDWQVVLPDCRRVGKVDDLIVDTSTMMVKYLEVKEDRHVTLSDTESWVLVPVELLARIDEDGVRVVIDHLPPGGLANAPRHYGRTPTAQEQRVINAYFEIVPLAPHGE